jgi:transposase
MSQDREERFRGLSALQGLGMIVFGAILVIVAAVFANKMARIAWALLAKGGTYRAPALVAAT